jgi:hypothetical protein
MFTDVEDFLQLTISLLLKYHKKAYLCDINMGQLFDKFSLFLEFLAQCIELNLGSGVQWLASGHKVR